MRWTPKRFTGLVAALYGAATLVTAGYAYYLEHNWYWHDARNHPAVEATVANQVWLYGMSAKLPGALDEMARENGWVLGYMTEAEGGDGAPILSASQEQVAGKTWQELSTSQSADQYWHGRADRVFPGPDGRRYSLWAVKRWTQLPWPLYSRIALITAAAAWISLATWLHFDAADRSRVPAVGWLLLGLLSGPVALGVWLVSRPGREGPPVKLVCPGCGQDAAAEHGFCVSCGYAVQPSCPECRRPVSVDWDYCGACGADLAEDRGERSNVG